MKRPTDQLLDELVEETASTEFRAALLEKTLHHARRRQRNRRVGIAAGLTMLLMALAAVFWKGPKPPEPSGPIASTHPIPPPGVKVIQSQPLQPVQIVQSARGSMQLVVSSSSTMSGLMLVQTRQSERTYAEITDQQLLGLLSGRQVSLVRHGPNAAELIFLNPDDLKELFVP